MSFSDLDHVGAAPPSIRAVDGDVDVPLAPDARPRVERAVEGDALAHGEQVLALLGLVVGLEQRLPVLLLEVLHAHPLLAGPLLPEIGVLNSQKDLKVNEIK